MKTKDFIEMEEYHIDTCKTLIENRGVCMTVNCEACPFAFCNNPKSDTCSTVGYSGSGIPTTMEDEKLVKSCKEFIKLWYYGGR